MTHISLKIKEDYIQRVMDFFKSLPEGAVEINNEGDEILTDDDKKAYEEALEDLKDGRTISIEDYLKKRKISV